MDVPLAVTLLYLKILLAGNNAAYLIEMRVECHRIEKIGTLEMAALRGRAQMARGFVSQTIDFEVSNRKVHL